MKLCSTFKYNRSLYPSKGIFFYKTSDHDFVPLEASISKIRGQKAGFTEGYTSNFKSKNLAPQDLAYCNPLILEECYVPPNIEHIYCKFSLRVQANSLHPSCCNDLNVSAFMSELSQAFIKSGGYKELALRYTKNILLGSWLWKNQNRNNTKIVVKTSLNNSYTISDSRVLSWDSKWPKEESTILEQLADELFQALIDPKIFWSAEITAKMSVDFCQEIYPSQLFLEKVTKGEPSKQFAKVKSNHSNEEGVSFNSVKIGAAIQKIDDWYSEETSKPIRAHEYGADSELVIARRHPQSKLDFYSLLSNSEKYLNELSTIKNNQIPPEMLYVFSILIKGGMFQKKGGD